MGNDGGSIPHRTEMVKTKQKEERKDNFEIAKAKSRFCAISKEPLKPPISICKMGLLYNKEEVVKRLIEKTIPKAFRHIRKLKDVKEAKVQFRQDKDGESNVIVCPVSQIEFNGFHPFKMIWSCGCVFSEESARELGLKDTCINCGAKIESKSDIISLNQSSDEQQVFLKVFDEQQKAADEKVAKKKEKKLTKKRKEREDEEVEIDVIKRQKLSEESTLAKQSEAVKSLFVNQYEENKDSDFLCRCVHRGLR